MERLCRILAALEEPLLALERRGISLRAHAARRDPATGRLPVFHVYVGAQEHWFTSREQLDAFLAQREAEAGKREFYRRTILAATGGKLTICDHLEIGSIAGPAVGKWEMKAAEDLISIRHEVFRIVERAGMEKSRAAEFVLVFGEAATNAMKHAKGGTASVHYADDGLMFVVSDNGPGMEALTLPDVALSLGYTTAKSLGMGYKAIISLADKVYLSTGPHGTTVAGYMGIKPPVVPDVLDVLPDSW